MRACATFIAMRCLTESEVEAWLILHIITQSKFKKTDGLRGYSSALFIIYKPNMVIF